MGPVALMPQIIPRSNRERHPGLTQPSPAIFGALGLWAIRACREGNAGCGSLSVSDLRGLGSNIGGIPTGYFGRRKNISMIGANPVAVDCCLLAGRLGPQDILAIAPSRREHLGSWMLRHGVFLRKLVRPPKLRKRRRAWRMPFIF